MVNFGYFAANHSYFLCFKTKVFSCEVHGSTYNLPYLLRMAHTSVITMFCSRGAGSYMYSRSHNFSDFRDYPSKEIYQSFKNHNKRVPYTQPSSLLGLMILPAAVGERRLCSSHKLMTGQETQTQVTSGNHPVGNGAFPNYH